MKLNLIEKLGDGAFADVWLAKDELEREVAVKIVRPASVGVAGALAHAKALARASHKNVVRVITLEKVSEPDSGEEVDCVVMELIDGITLTKRLAGEELTSHELLKLGVGIIDGLSHIHAQDMTHGDLHTDNVMVVDSDVKIIDILYLSTLATVSTEAKETRLKRDLISLRLLLQQLLLKSEFDPAEATEFNNLLGVDTSCEEMKSAFLEIVSPESLGADGRLVEHAFARIADQDFIAGGAYAAALDEETPASVVLPLLKQMVVEKVFDPVHQDYVRAIWSRLPVDQRAELLSVLCTAIDEDTPKGRWSPNLQLLVTLGTEGWLGLSNLVQLRLEGLIIKDVLAGHKDIYSVKTVSGGALGTYAIRLWENFRRPNDLADNLISLLRQGWYTQNYVGSFFFQVIPEIAKVTGRRAEFILALRIAARNDARLIVNRLEQLPTDWVDEIRKET